MRSPFARWKVRHLVASWVGYWAVLAAATLTPAAIALWKVSRDGAKGSANVSLGDAGLHAIISTATSTLWETTVPVTTVALALAAPPLVLWVCWLLSASTSRETVEGPPPTGQLGRGDELPLRRAERSKDAVH